MKYKKSVSIALVVVYIITALSARTQHADASGETLTLRGDGLSTEITFSRAELEALGAAIERHVYSVSNNYPTEKTEYTAGVPLSHLLYRAGLRDEAKKIIFTASDGYRREFTVSELLTQPRYSYAGRGGRKTVPVLVCIESGTDGFDKLRQEELKLVMGQRSAGEQTNPWFVKYLSVIEVSCDIPEKWQEVTFSRTAERDGVTVTLDHENLDLVKIYYTTDGTVPTVDSKMYNISASYYQPQLNKPLLISETTTVRAVAIGPGKENSAVSSITVYPRGGDSNKSVFTDLTGYEREKMAIEVLAEQGIVNGVGDNRFDPAGVLTRGMFAAMLSRAFNEESGAAMSADETHFSDVDYSAWYAPHVQWAAQRGIADGYPDGTFKPDGILTVEEMLVMAVRAGRLAQNGTKPVLHGDVSGWAVGYILAAEEAGILVRGVIAQDTADGGVSVEGQSKASRAQAAVTLYELLLRFDK